MSSGSFAKLTRSWLFWEIVALVIVVGAIAVPILVPLLFDDFLLGRAPGEIVIRMYIKEGGGYDPDVITVSRGKPVRLILVSMDLTHSLTIPELDVDSGPVHAGDRKVIEFTPLEPGTFIFRCVTYCSPMHPFMTGKLVVQ